MGWFVKGGRPNGGKVEQVGPTCSKDEIGEFGACLI